jgi:hypothetical protein
MNANTHISRICDYNFAPALWKRKTKRSAKVSSSFLTRTSRIFRPSGMRPLCSQQTRRKRAGTIRSTTHGPRSSGDDELHRHHDDCSQRPSGCGL